MKELSGPPSVACASELTPHRHSMCVRTEHPITVIFTPFYRWNSHSTVFRHFTRECIGRRPPTLGSDGGGGEIVRVAGQQVQSEGARAHAAHESSSSNGETRGEPMRAEKGGDGGADTVSGA